MFEAGLFGTASLAPTILAQDGLAQDGLAQAILAQDVLAPINDKKLKPEKVIKRW